MSFSFIEFYQRTDGIEDAIRAMDLANVPGAIMYGMPFTTKWGSNSKPQPDYYLETNEPSYWYSATDFILAHEILRLPKQQQKRIYPFICGFNLADKNAVEHVKRLVEMFPGF